MEDIVFENMCRDLIENPTNYKTCESCGEFVPESFEECPSCELTNFIPLGPRHISRARSVLMGV